MSGRWVGGSPPGPPARLMPRRKPTQLGAGPPRRAGGRSPRRYPPSRLTTRRGQPDGLRGGANTGRLVWTGRGRLGLSRPGGRFPFRFFVGPVLAAVPIAALRALGGGCPVGGAGGP